MSPSESITLGSWDALGEEAYAIRYEVFVREQGVPVELEHDENDTQCLHALVRDANGAALATGRLLPDGHIGRVAVRSPHRGRGLGHRLMQALIAEARQRGHRELVLHAQVDAQGFYADLGFEQIGETFMEAGIAHVGMRMSLS